MHILHGTWIPELEKFAVWAEDTAVEPSYLKGRRGKIAPHPFAIDKEAILSHIEQWTTDARAFSDVITIWLPGKSKKVQPSPQAQAAGAVPLEYKVDLMVWRADTALLDPTDALDFLLQLPEQGERGIQLGDDLCFWQQIALLAVNCLVEGRFIPALSREGKQYHAYWEPRPDPAIVQQMALAMPALCRAMAEDVQNPPAPATLINHFLDFVIGTFILEHYSSLRAPKNPWLRALTGHAPFVSDKAKDNQRLYEAWKIWQAFGEQGGNFKICFRLSEPEPNKDDWHIDYLLQANDDPSLLVEAQEVWSAESAHIDYLEYRFHRPQEKLLTGLGLASRMFEPIERSLRQAKPSGIDLSREEAYLFLTEALPLLETSGFAVLVPNWWGRRAHIRARAKIKGQTNEPTGILTRDSILRYEWQLSLGGEAISRDEFEALVELKQPLVRYKGEWVALDPDQIDAAMTFFEQAQNSDMTLEEALKTHATDTDVDGIEVENTEIEGWLEDVFERLYNPEQTPSPPPPNGLQATLRPYQLRGFGWLAQMRQMGLGACLADDMGLGKTLQTITVWLHEREQLEVKHPALLVCPTSVVGNWRHEIRKFAPALKVLTHHGADRLQDEAFIKAVAEVDVVLTSYALLRRDLETFQQVEWSDMVLDEAQNIKNPSTKMAQAARNIPADFKLALTGTPVENRLTELWSIFQFLNPGYLGSQKAFKSNFATPIERYGDQEASTALKKLTAPFILRRVKTDASIIQDLPDKFENKVYCTMTPEQVTLYEAAVREAMEAVESADENMARRGNILRMLTQLKQICNHPAHFLKEGASTPLPERSGKLDRLTDMIDEIRENGERLLIFTQYAEMGDILQTHLRKYLVDEVLFLHGGTPSKHRDEMVRRFQSPQGPPVFILSLKAGGTGLTLTAANHVFHFDRWYNPAVENQATDRAFRIGQTKNVQVHKFICLGTLEERIDEMIEKKQALAESVIGSGESWISELDNNELHDLVALRHDAMEV